MSNELQSPDGYGIPQGIEIGKANRSAVPRKEGAYDTEGINGDGSAVVPTQLQLFQNTRSFAESSLTISNKVIGRDHNITAKNAGMGKGERLYVYGFSAKIDALNVTLDSTANAVWFDEIRRLIGISAWQLTLGGDTWKRMQARDVPTLTPRPGFHTRTQGTAADGFLITPDCCERGMYDMTIAGQPYVLDAQEDFGVNFDMAPQSLALIVDTYVTARFEGIRLKALRI